MPGAIGAVLGKFEVEKPGLCGELFEGVKSKQAKEDVRLTRANCLINATDYEFDGSMHSTEHSSYRLRDLMRPDRARRLARKAVAAGNRGQFRNMQRISIFTTKCWLLGSSRLRPRTFSALNELVVNPALKTTRSPYIEARGPGEFPYEALKALLRYRDPSGLQSEACGGWSDLMNLAEGEVWMQTMEGYRIPKAYYESHGRFETCQRNTMTLMTQEEIR